LKLLLLSGIAVIPLLLLSPRLLELFAGRGRVIAYGVPLAINAIIFAAIGIGLLFLTRDKQLHALIRIIRRKPPKADE
jgi:putative peptidoglycan lipid II flippase